MSNDLLFSVLPREGKIPVVHDDRVQRVSKEARAKNLSEEEKETHDEERLISEQQQYKVHEKLPRHQQDSTDGGTQQQPEPQQADSPDPSTEEEVVYNSHGETAEHHLDKDDDTPHIDIYE